MTRSARAPLPRKRDIEVAIAAYNAANPDILLPPEAVQLLTIIFRRSGMCQRSVVQLAAASGDSVKVVTRLLHLLTEAGFLSKEQSLGRVPNVYRLHLPPVRR
jgi:hypothetical protein